MRLHESLDTSAKPLKECMERGRAVLAEGTVRAKAWRGEAMSNFVGNGGHFDLAEALVCGDVVIR